MSDTIFVIGRYQKQERLSGSVKFVKRLYENINPGKYKIEFIDFYFGYHPVTLFRKVFGKEILTKRQQVIFYRLGIFSLIKNFFAKKPKAVLITSLEGYGLLLLPFKRFLKFKTYYTLHGLYDYELLNDKLNKEPAFFRWKYKFLEKGILKRSDTIILYSRLSCELFNKYYPQINTNLIFLKHGVDGIFYYKKEYFNNGDVLKVVYVGGIGRELKGFEFLIEEMKLIDFPMELHVGGKITNRDNLDNTITSLNENVNIKIEGFLTVQELAVLYKTADIFVLPSRYETFGIAVLEAAASSLCCIISQNTGVAEYLTNMKDAVFVDLDKSGSLSQVLKELNSNRDMLKKIATEGYKNSLNFKWKDIARDYFKIIIG